MATDTKGGIMGAISFRGRELDMPNLFDALWGTNVRRSITSTLATITATAACIVAVPPAWQAMGLPEVASKVYVHAQVDPVKLAQADTTRAVYLLTLNQLQSSLYAAEQDQVKSPSPTVDQRIQELKDQIAQTQAKINGVH